MLRLSHSGLSYLHMGGRGPLPSCWIDPRICFWARCWVGMNGNIPRERRLWVFSHRNCSQEIAVWCVICHVCMLIYIVWHYPQTFPHLWECQNHPRYPRGVGSNLQHGPTKPTASTQYPQEAPVIHWDVLEHINISKLLNMVLILA